MVEVKTCSLERCIEEAREKKVLKTRETLYEEEKGHFLSGLHSYNLTLRLAR